MELYCREPVIWRKAGGKKRNPVLFVHGMWGWHWAWSNFVDRFRAAGYDCFAVDLRGHGPAWDSPVGGGESVAGYTADLAAAAQKIASGGGEAPPILIGHSMGGLIVQKAAERIAAEKIVLIASALPRGLRTSPPVRTSLLFAKYYVKSIPRRPVLPSADELRYMVFHNVSGGELRTALDRYVPESGTALRQLAAGCIAVDRGKISCPVLVVGGGKDRIIDAASTRRLAGTYGAECILSPDHGHWLIREDGWEAVCGRVLEWAG